jgi:hypothetical protein
MKKKTLFILIGMLAVLLLVVSVAIAAGGYDLSWWTVDSGGGTSIGGGYTLNGTIGQPDAGSLTSGGGYTLAGGFWHGGVTAATEKMKVYLPLLRK